MRRIFLLLLFCAASFDVPAAESWQLAVSKMPLNSAVTQLNRTNCVGLLLRTFQSNDVVRALVFMPGATDEFYMFRRARAQLTNSSPSLLDAITALTNQTLIRATFRSPMLLLHTDEDPLEPLITIQNKSAATRLRKTAFEPHSLYHDRDWDFIQPILKRKLKIDILPWQHRYDSWHFYRHSFAGWDLTGWEALEATALAGKTRFTVGRQRGNPFRSAMVFFEGDERVRATPKLEAFPRD
jgi:hypothetical protein